MLAGFLLLLFFAPLALVYGRSVARSLRRRALAKNRSALRLGLPRLVFPALLAAAMAVSLIEWHELIPALPALLARNGVFMTALNGFRLLGHLGVVLFFLAIPYVLGSLFGVAGAALGLPRELGAPEPSAEGRG